YCSILLLLVLFPTRRCSDLILLWDANAEQFCLLEPPQKIRIVLAGSIQLGDVRFELPVRQVARDLLRTLVVVGQFKIDHVLSPRSEEHTSELQSRENLDCRL